MKILWISNSPRTNSGYGSQTRQAGSRIAKAGYEIEFATNEGQRGDSEWNGLLLRGMGGDKYSRDTIREDLERSGADWLISLYDAWVYTERREDPFKGLDHIAGWVPVDHWPTPRILEQWLSEGHMAIAMSRFGFDCLTKNAEDFKRAGLKGFPVRYAPHAVDDAFRPVETTFRTFLDIPNDAYLVGIVAANYGGAIFDRKGFGEMCHAMSLFMQGHPDAYLYMHTLPRNPDGLDLPVLMEFLHMDPERVRWADPYAIKKAQITDELMAEVYSSFDVLLATSRGEGFGLPVIEAQACGVPVIASNWTAQAELVGEPWSIEHPNSVECASGWLIGVQPLFDDKQVGFWGVPRTHAILAALETAYDRRGDPTLKAAAIAKAELYRADTVFDTYWRPILAEMEEALKPKTRQQRRAAVRAKAVA